MMYIFVGQLSSASSRAVLFSAVLCSAESSLIWVLLFHENILQETNHHSWMFSRGIVTTSAAAQAVVSFFSFRGIAASVSCIYILSPFVILPHLGVSIIAHCKDSFAQRVLAFLYISDD